ncbi:MAG: hypothetical protein JSV04_03845 [Candidatus Heimdallarchaeota archaeon]|nr:MAG: hypothetical protein JSV04_03845 [Candidatus Heimdallarchaeota archaeon]
MTKNKCFRKTTYLGPIIVLFLGLLVLTSPLQGAAEITHAQQPPIDIPQPGIPFEIPSDGTPVSLVPGEELILETPAGVTISLIVGKGVNISVIESTDLPAEAGTLPEEAYGIGLYLTIELTDSEVQVEATLSLPYDPATLPEGVAAEQLYFAFYNASTEEWQGVPSWVDTTNNVVYADTTHFSTWTILGTDQGPPIDIPQPGKPFEVPGNGSAVSLIPGENLILETPSGVSINLTVGESVSISINETTINPTGDLPANARSVGKYLQIEFNETDVEVEATISMPYTDGDLPPGVAEGQLYFAFYNASTGEWQGVPSWVDTTTNVVYANTTHFSTWTVLGEIESTEPTSPTTTLQQSFLWLDDDVRDGFLALATIFTLVLAVVAIINRRQK